MSVGVGMGVGVGYFGGWVGECGIHHETELEK
jgi:hypothetical protein